MCLLSLGFHVDNLATVEAKDWLLVEAVSVMFGWLHFPTSCGGQGQRSFWSFGTATVVDDVKSRGSIGIIFMTHQSTILDNTILHVFCQSALGSYASTWNISVKLVNMKKIQLSSRVFF